MRIAFDDHIVINVAGRVGLTSARLVILLLACDCEQTEVGVYVP
jgi:hypothetical protein